MPLSKDSDFCLNWQLSCKSWVCVVIPGYKASFPLQKMYYFKIRSCFLSLEVFQTLLCIIKKQKTLTVPDSVLPFCISLRLKAAKIAVLC